MMFGCYGLLFDVWVYYMQFDDLYEFVCVFEDVVVVIDYFGGFVGVGLYVGWCVEVYVQWKW